VGTSRTSLWHAGHARSPAGRPLSPGCGRRTPAWTPSPPTRSSCGHPAVTGRATDMADLSTVQSAGHPQFNRDRLADESGPGPDGDGQAADTPAPSVRPCARPAGHGQPRGLLIPALTGQEACPCSPTPPRSLPARDPSVVATCTHARCWNVREPGPLRCPRGRVRRPAGRPDRTAVRTPHARSDPAGHRPLHLARHHDLEATRPGERTNGTAGIRILDRHDHQDGPPGHAEPPCGPGLQLGNQGG
jgi:hypothetical protein